MCWLADNTASCLCSGGCVAGPLSCQIIGKKGRCVRTVNPRDSNVCFWYLLCGLPDTLMQHWHFLSFCAMGWYSDDMRRCHSKWLYCCSQDSHSAGGMPSTFQKKMAICIPARRAAWNFLGWEFSWCFHIIVFPLDEYVYSLAKKLSL